MLFAINTRSPVPLYEQIQTSITRLALAGAIAPHDKLPSVRQIAKDYGINPNTVSKAYSLLETQGILYTVPGRGCFVAENASHNQHHQQALLAQFEQLVSECQASLITYAQLAERLAIIYQPTTSSPTTHGGVPTHD